MNVYTWTIVIVLGIISLMSLANAASYHNYPVVGDRGRHGSPGVNGIKGATGQTGAMGAMGTPSVVVGPTGAPGTPGPVGAPGSTGTPGAMGAPGSPGAVGAPGIVGPTGPAGPFGGTLDDSARVELITPLIVPVGTLPIVYDFASFGGANFNPLTPTRVAIPSTGIYQIGGTMNLLTGAPVVTTTQYQRGLSILVNGALTLASNIRPYDGTDSSTTGLPNQFTVMTQYQLNIGDYVELIAHNEDTLGTLPNQGSMTIIPVTSLWIRRL